MAIVWPLQEAKNKLSEVIDRAAYTEPFQYPEGIRIVVVNGKIALENGQPTEQRAGRAIRKLGL
jgi:N-acyl-D-aspartate/D-glutamate deacylase